MLLLAAVASLWLASPAAADAPPWLEAQRSMGHLAAFRIHVDLHGAPEDRAALSPEAVRTQIASTLRAAGIEVRDSGEDALLAVHGLGTLALDVHVLAHGQGTALAWTLQLSQAAQVMTGAMAFATTWEVGDLVDAPPSAAAQRFRASLQPALDEFCALYAAARPPREAPRTPVAPGEAERPKANPPGVAL